MSNKREQVEANKSKLERILDEAEKLGVKGFTNQEMAKLLGIHRELAVALVYKLRIRNEIVPIASKFRCGRQQVFKFHQRSNLALPTEKRDPSKPPKNLFEYIETHGHDEDWEPKAIPKAVQDLPGSFEKIEAMRRRLERGEDIWNADEDVIHGYGRCKPMEVRQC